jgi:4-amino-4-deoxy-L-arabinose transferase-like glycosyltransferase
MSLEGETISSRHVALDLETSSVVGARSQEVQPFRAWMGPALIGLIGLGLRIWVVRSPLGPIDSDEAVGGLIALHFLDGDWTTFFWGQHYGGTIEALFTAPIFALLGTGPATLKIVPIAMYGLAALLTWRIGRRTVGPSAAIIAAFLLWIGSGPLVLLSTKARMFYGATLVITCTVMLLCLRLAARRSRSDMAVLGFAAGLGLWAHPSVFYASVPIVVWLFVTRPGRLRDAPLAIPMAVLGAAPWLLYNVRNDWVGLQNTPLPIDTSYPERFVNYFRELVPRLLGLRTYWGEWVLGRLGAVIFLVAVSLLIMVTLQYIRRRGGPLTPLLMIVWIYPVIFAIPEPSFYVNEPRYGFFVAPAIALLAAAGLTRATRRPSLQFAAVLGVAALSAISLAVIMNFAKAHPGHWDLSPPRLTVLADSLEARGIHKVTSEYWLAYALTFESDEDIIANPPSHVRYPPYRDAVWVAGSADYVFFRGSPEAVDLIAKADEWEIAYEEILVDGFVIYRLERPLD